MPKILNKNINDAEHYNDYWGKRNFNIDYTEPVRADALMNKFQGGKFIDLGCGTYPYCQMALKKEGSEVWGLDISYKAIESLRKNFPTINYIVGDVRDLPLKDNLFDYITAGEVLEHMEKPDEALKEMTRILKVGGIMALSVPNNDMGGYAIDWHIWSFTKDEFEAFLKPFGEVEIIWMTENNHRYGHLIAYLTKK